MALATKPKSTPAHKKRRAQHHRSKSKHYVKPYLPYLPMLFVALAGFAINGLWPPANAAAYSVNDRPLSRIEIMTRSELALVLVVAVTSIAFTLLVVRHGYYLRKAMNRGEFWVVHHPWIDVVVTVVVVAGILLTRTGGIY